MLQSSNRCCFTLKYQRGRKENIENTFSDKFNKTKFGHINNNFRFEWECHELIFFYCEIAILGTAQSIERQNKNLNRNKRTYLFSNFIKLINFFVYSDMKN